MVKLINIPLVLFCLLSLKSLIIDPSLPTLGCLAICGMVSFLIEYKINAKKLDQLEEVLQKQLKEFEVRISETEKLAKDARTYTSTMKISQQFTGKN